MKTSLCHILLFCTFMLMAFCLFALANAELPQILLGPNKTICERKSQIKPTDTTRKLASLVTLKALEKNYSLDRTVVDGFVAVYSIYLNNKPMGKAKYCFGAKYPDEKSAYQEALSEEQKELFDCIALDIHTIIMFGTYWTDDPNANAIKKKDGYFLESCNPKNPDRVIFYSHISNDFRILQEEMAIDTANESEEIKNELITGKHIRTFSYERYRMGGKYFIKEMTNYSGELEGKIGMLNYKFEYSDYKGVIFLKNIKIKALIPDEKTNEYKIFNSSMQLKSIIFEKKDDEGDSA